MTKDLLNKRTRKLNEQRQNTPTPKSIFTTDQLKTKKKSRPATTTSRVTYESVHGINSLITMGVGDTFGEVVDMLLDNYVKNNLTKEEKNTYRSLRKIFSDKSK